MELTQCRSSAERVHRYQYSHPRISILRPTRVWEALAFKYVAEMPTTSTASDLYACHAKRAVLMTVHCAWDGCMRVSALHHKLQAREHTVEERRPSAPTAKLGRALVQGGVAPGAGVNPLLRELVVLSSTSGFGTLLPEDAELEPSI